MGSSDTTGETLVPNEGGPYGRTTAEGSDPEIILPVGQETSTVAIIAEDSNAGKVYLGWDTDLTTSNGFPLAAGQSISIDFDNTDQPLYVVSDNVGDSVRFLSLE